MNKYSNGKVYIITGPDQEGECYIGSTIQCSRKRWNGHVGAYNAHKRGSGKTYYSSFILFDKYGIDQCNMLVLEEYNASSRSELLKQEQHWIAKTNKCINKIQAHTTVEEAKAKEKVYKSTPEFKSKKRAENRACYAQKKYEELLKRKAQRLQLQQSD